MSLRTGLVVATMLLGCDQPVAAKRDPERSSSVSVSAKKRAAEIRCRTGALVGKELKMPRARTTTVDGYALPSNDFHVDDINRQACAQLGAMSICIEATRPAGQKALEGDVEAELSFDAGVVTNTKIRPGGLDDAAIHKCVTDALSNMRFIGGSGTVRYHMTIVARRLADPDEE